MSPIGNEKKHQQKQGWASHVVHLVPTPDAPNPLGNWKSQRLRHNFFKRPQIHGAAQQLQAVLQGTLAGGSILK